MIEKALNKVDTTIEEKTTPAGLIKKWSTPKTVFGALVGMLGMAFYLSFSGDRQNLAEISFYLVIFGTCYLIYYALDRLLDAYAGRKELEKALVANELQYFKGLYEKKLTIADNELAMSDAARVIAEENLRATITLYRTQQLDELQKTVDQVVEKKMEFQDALDQLKKK